MAAGGAVLVQRAQRIRLGLEIAANEDGKLFGDAGWWGLCGVGPK